MKTVQRIIISSFILVILILLAIKHLWITVIDGSFCKGGGTAAHSNHLSASRVLYTIGICPVNRRAKLPMDCRQSNQCNNLEEISRILGRPVFGNKVQLFPLKAGIIQIDKLLSQKGVVLLNIADRYRQGGILSHVIGYQSENGGFGIERAMNNELDKDLNNEFLIINSAQQQAISGLGLKLKSDQNLSGVKLTIDYHIQKICEQIMDKHLPKGAVIVADAKTAIYWQWQAAQILRKTILQPI